MVDLTKNNEMENAMERFIYDVIDELENRLDGVTITPQKVVKSNDVVLNGLTIRKDEESVSPTIYIDGDYDLWKTGAMTLEEIVDKVIATYENSDRPDTSKIIEMLEDFEKAKTHIIPIVRSIESNNKLLEQPHVKHEDLGLFEAYKVRYEDMAVTITNEIMNQWGIDVEAIRTVAWENSKLCKNDFWGMPLITNEAMVEGAVFILDNEQLKAYKNGESFYILPSSIHEILVFDVEFNEDNTNAMFTMVKEVNSTNVDPKDKLIDALYYFDGEKVTKIA